VKGENRFRTRCIFHKNLFTLTRAVVLYEASYVQVNPQNESPLEQRFVLEELFMRLLRQVIRDYRNNSTAMCGTGGDNAGDNARIKSSLYRRSMFS
jgi:hypothetical protein